MITALILLGIHWHVAVGDSCIHWGWRPGLLSDLNFGLATREMEAESSPLWLFSLGYELHDIRPHRSIHDHQCQQRKFIIQSEAQRNEAEQGCAKWGWALLTKHFLVQVTMWPLKSMLLGKSYDANFVLWQETNFRSYLCVNNQVLGSLHIHSVGLVKRPTWQA